MPRSGHVCALALASRLTFETCTPARAHAHTRTTQKRGMQSSARTGRQVTTWRQASRIDDGGGCACGYRRTSRRRRRRCGSGANARSTAALPPHCRYGARSDARRTTPSCRHVLVVAAWQTVCAHVPLGTLPPAVRWRSRGRRRQCRPRDRRRRLPPPSHLLPQPAARLLPAHWSGKWMSLPSCVCVCAWVVVKLCAPAASAVARPPRARALFTPLFCAHPEPLLPATRAHATSAERRQRTHVLRHHHHHPRPSQDARRALHPAPHCVSCVAGGRAGATRAASRVGCVAGGG